ncbi:DUF4262 domain-containing protein [Cryptosporangium japonicum]|uniref:DUF4262 domain-containing protein n=1 Tax=Cryptosporangium japonicum TaxID=80872 RepID=A0ABP3DZJ4_9ACTN
MSDRRCPCVLCVPPPHHRDASLAATVDEHGWSVLRITGAVEFAHTVGSWHTFGRPELVMFGLDGGQMQHWLNRCVAELRTNGWPEPETPFAGVLEGFDTQLRPVDESWRGALFGTAHRFYQGRPVPVWQLVWPDARGRWPGDPDATVSSRTRQAWAWLPVDDHPPGGWRLLGHFADDFPLAGEPDSWALTTRGVLDGTRAVSTVLLDDSAFDVLDDRGHDADDLCVTYLGHLVLRHPGLRRLSDLPDGSVARPDADDGWRRATISAPEQEASIAAWKRAEQYLPT